MKIAAACCTYRRPEHLGMAIHGFMAQTYADRQLTILDDAGQFDAQRGDRWELHSAPERFPTLGAKRNACMALALADPSVESVAVMDDDDYYFPHWLEAIAACLASHPWCVAEWVYVERPAGQLTRLATARSGTAPHHHFHAAWGFRRDAFLAGGGYLPTLSHGEDTEMYLRLAQRLGPPADATAGAPPYFVWNGIAPRPTTHLSLLAPANGYASLAGPPAEKTAVCIRPAPDYAAMAAAERAARLGGP
jgi:glycosyltransferase involved in cell wall biosynthesis